MGNISDPMNLTAGLARKRHKGGGVSWCAERPHINAFVCVHTNCGDGSELATAGRLVAVVRAKEAPDPSLAKLFEGQPKGLKQTQPPKRASKHERWLVEKRPGRVFVHTMDRWTYWEELEP